MFRFIRNNSRIWHTIVQQICVFNGAYWCWSKLNYIPGLRASLEECWRTALYNLPGILRHAHSGACRRPYNSSCPHLPLLLTGYYAEPFRSQPDWAGDLCSLQCLVPHQERAKPRAQWSGESVQVHVLSTVNSQDRTPLFHFLGNVGIPGITDEQWP